MPTAAGEDTERCFNKSEQYFYDYKRKRIALNHKKIEM